MKLSINKTSFNKMNWTFHLLAYVFQGHQDMWTNLLTIWWKMSRMGNASGLTTSSKVSLLYICLRLGFCCCVIQISHPKVPAVEVFVSFSSALFMGFCRRMGLDMVQTCCQWLLLVGQAWSITLCLRENESGWTSRNPTGSKLLYSK